MIHCGKIHIRGFHADAYGHVNNARFLEFLEEGRWAFLDGRVKAEEFHSRGVGFSVVNININYKRPVFPGNTLDLFTSLESVGERSAVIYQEIRLEESGNIAADAKITFVLFDMDTGKAKPIQGELRSLIVQMKE